MTRPQDPAQAVGGGEGGHKEELSSPVASGVEPVHFDPAPASQDGGSGSRASYSSSSVVHNFLL